MTEEPQSRTQPRAQPQSQPQAAVPSLPEGGETTLRARDFTLELRRDVPLLMGIVNVGNDSVADQLRLADLPAQVKRSKALIHSGASIVDVGVQSGRTDTREIPAEEEIELLLPLVSRLHRLGAIVSVDTYRASVAEAAVKAGASIINDVGGLSDPEIADVAARSSAGLVLMHTKAPPKTVSFPRYQDPVADVRQMLEALVEVALEAGVSEQQLILDPGLDYAKTPQESIEVLKRIGELHVLHRPLLLAVSRKYFLGMITNRPPMERLPSTLAAIGFGVDAGASILRVHDVAEVSDFLAVRSALSGRGPARLLGDPDAEALKWLPPKADAPPNTLKTGAHNKPAKDLPDTSFTTMKDLPDTPLTTIAPALTTGAEKEG